MKNFKDLIKEIKKENKQDLVKKQKGMSFDFNQPFTKRKLDEINTINKINEIIKHRDLPMEKVSYEHWLKVLQNKMVEELDPRYAKKLYEQDMSRVEKYNALSKKSGGGRNRVTYTTETPFDPLTVSPVLWWDADDASTITYDLGTSVTQWVDKSGNSVAAYQNTDNDQPVRTTRSWFQGGTAGGNVISTETNDKLWLPDLPETVDGDGQFTHFVVMSVKAYGNYKTWYQLGGNTTPTWRHFGMGGASSGHIFKTTKGTNTQGHRTGFNNPKDVDTAYLIVFIGDAAAGYSTRLNGSEKSAPDGDTPLQMVNHNTFGFPHTGGGIGFGGCDIAEMIHVPRLCTATEIADVENYLNTKWGVY